MKKKNKIIISVATLVLAMFGGWMYWQQRFSADTVEVVIPPVITDNVATLKGNITDINDRPMSGLKIGVDSNIVISDKDGNYAYTSVTPGRQPVLFFDDNRQYQPLSSGIDGDSALFVSPGQDMIQDFSVVGIDFVELEDDWSSLSLLFDELSTPKTADSSGLGNHATTKDTTIADGHSATSGKARYFNGTSAFASVPDNDSLKPEKELTLSSWVRLGTTEENSRIIDKSLYAGTNKGGYSLMVGGGTDKNKAVFSLYSSSGQERKCVSTTDLPKGGAWFHLAATYNGTVSKIYIDGKEVCNQTFSTDETIKHVTNPLNLGRYTGVSRHHLRGSLDEVRIYAKTLTLEEVGVLVRGE